MLLSDKFLMSWAVLGFSVPQPNVSRYLCFSPIGSSPMLISSTCSSPPPPPPQIMGPWILFRKTELLIRVNLRRFPGGSAGKEPVSQSRRLKRQGFNPWDGTIP